MGTAFTSLLKALNCGSCNKYFLNELECDSDCCAGKLCNVHLETHETGKENDSEDEFVSECCTMHHKG